MDLFPFIRAAFDKTAFDPPEGRELVSVSRNAGGGRGLYVPPELLRRAAQTGFERLSFFFRPGHLALLSDRLRGPGVSENDRLSLTMLLRNAVTAAKGELALCQDTGTAVIYGWKDEGVYTGGGDRAGLEAGTAAAYKNKHLRSSQIAFSSFFDEYNTGSNLPAQIHIEAAENSGGGPAYRFLFIAKGGGSSNKTSLFQMTAALLEETAFERFLEEKISALGTAACPPYRLAVVAGGSSPEFNLEVQKLAAAEALDAIPYFGEERTPGQAFPARDHYWEQKAMDIGRRTGLGAQFGGASLLLDARVIRLPRHAASFPVSIGVSCIAHRCLLAYIDREGLHLEKTVRDPAAFLKAGGLVPETAAEKAGNRVDIEKPVKAFSRRLKAFRAGDLTLLSGKLLVARDAAHLKWHSLILEGNSLPAYLSEYPVYYAGPSETPPGRVIGSLGPTTAGRMDPYAEELMSRGAALVTVAKGNRSALWREACKKYGGFYLGTPGGAAALLAEEHVTASEILDYPELGMEAVRLITVKDLPAFVIIDSEGGDLYAAALIAPL
jgi:fumarate hydratase class I